MPTFTGTETTYADFLADLDQPITQGDMYRAMANLLAQIPDGPEKRLLTLAMGFHAQDPRFSDYARFVRFVRDAHLPETDH